MRLLLTVPLLLVLAGCGPSAADRAAPPPAGSPAPSEDLAGGGIARADNDLAVSVDVGDGSPVQEWSLTCVGFVEGSHPQAQAACAHLHALANPFAPLPSDVACTEQYGGPQTARVSGVWSGAPVELALSRVDGCAIAQWDGLVPLVPAVS